MKKILLAVLLLITALPASAQLVTVTGQVKDSNGIPYAGATMKAQLVSSTGSSVPNPTITISVLATCRANGFGSAPCNIPFTPSNGPFTLDGSGNIPGGGISVQDNSLITPAATQWQFSVNTNGNPPPLGTGPQVCSATVTVTGASQSISSSFSACPALSNVTGGGTSGGAFDNTVNPLQPAYGAKGGVKGLPNCSWTSATQTITCSDGPFAAGDVGKIMFGTRSCAQVNVNCLTNSLDFSVGTIASFISATQVTVSTTAAATCPDGTHPNCNFYWGAADDTAAIQAAENAAWNTPGLCRALQFSADWYFIRLNSPLFNGPIGNACATATGPTAFSDLVSVGPSMYGQGQQSSKLIILPDSTFAGCVNGPSASSCMGTAPNLQVHDMGIDGGQAPIGGTHANVLWESVGANGGGGCDGGATVWNMAFAGFGLTSTNLVGFQAGKQSCNDPYHYNVNVTMFGSIPCSFFPENTLNLAGFLCFGGNIRAMQVGPGPSSGPHVLNTKQSGFYSSLTSGNQVVDVTGTGAVNWNSDSDHILNSNVTSTQYALIREDVAGNFHFTNLTASLPNPTNATTVLLFANASGANNRFDHSTLTATGANNQLFNTVAGSALFDDGGNTFTNGSVANSFNGSVFNSLSITGTLQTAGNFADGAGLGTSTFGTITGSSTHGQVTVTYAGALATPATWTMTFPVTFLVPPSCTVTDVGGTNPFPTQIVSSATTTTLTTTLTFAAAPVAANTDIFVWNCSN